MEPYAISLNRSGTTFRCVWAVPANSTCEFFYAGSLVTTNWLPADPPYKATSTVLTCYDNMNTSGRYYQLRLHWPGPLLVTPYAGQENLGPINEAYSATAACPWGFAHDGIDFFPTANFKEFRACESGRVMVVDRFRNPGNSNWQVNLTIQHDDQYKFGYAFEPMSSSSNHGATQLANIAVTAGQHLARGQTLGYLYSASNGAHVHYGFYTNWTPICPEPYFTQSARTSILHLIRLAWPGAEMCY